MARGRKKQKIISLISQQNQNQQLSPKIQRRGRKKKIIKKRGRKFFIISAHKNKQNSKQKHKLFSKNILSQTILNQGPVNQLNMQATVRERGVRSRNSSDLKSVQKINTESNDIVAKRKRGRKPKRKQVIKSQPQLIDSLYSLRVMLERREKSQRNNSIELVKNNSIQQVYKPKTRSEHPIITQNNVINNQSLKQTVQSKKQGTSQLAFKKRGRKPKVQNQNIQSRFQKNINQNENILQQFINLQDQMRLTRGKKQLYQKPKQTVPRSIGPILKKENKGVKILKELIQKSKEPSLISFSFKKKITKKRERMKRIDQQNPTSPIRGISKKSEQIRRKRFLLKGRKGWQNKLDLKQIKSQLKQIIQQKRRGRGRKLKKRRGRPKQIHSEKHEQQKIIEVQNQKLIQESIQVKRKPGRPPKDISINQPIIRKQINILNTPLIMKKQQFRPYDQHQIKVVDKFLEDLIQIRKIKSVMQIYSNRSQIYDFIKDSCKYGQLGKINHIPILKQVQQILEKKVISREIKSPK